MLKNRQTLIRAIRSFPVVFKEEQKIKHDFLTLLEHEDSFQRNHLPGHVTGSAWIVNRTLTKTVLILHARLGRWLQPGGHADGDEDVLRVAMREAREETGLAEFEIPDPSIFDLDIHPIPERKDFPAHLHYDVRFILFVDESLPLIISDESTGLQWVALDEVKSLTGNNSSMMRLVAKTNTLAEKLKGPPAPKASVDK